VATTDEVLQQLQAEIRDKKKSLEEKQRKGAELQRLIQNDQTKEALVKESENLDAALAQADAHLGALEDASGVSADSIKLPVTRSASDEAPATPAVAPAPVPDSATPTEATTSTSAKRGK
jgi:septal ring factor EnvC (AmiA/AmiB activator)